jgi:sugar phosphate isomerase/epimerase
MIIFLMLFQKIYLAGLASLLLSTAAASANPPPSLYSPTNLVAWCIVPFDAKKRPPEERAQMLEKLGFKHFAYDYRAEHIPTFNAEIEALRRHHIDLLAWWFPTTLNDEARLILATLKNHHEHPQLWVMGGGDPTHSPEEQRARVLAEADRIAAIAREAAAIGCKVGLYNHGAWFGEPENQVEIIQELKTRGINNVGIVYNLHHGHDHLDRFPQLLQKMKPYLLVVNINGMVRDGEKTGKKIVPLGQGDLDLKLLKEIQDSGWRGPIGILNHTDEDAELRLKQNLEGLAKLTPQLPAPAR